jgi:hypothetical protein
VEALGSWQRLRLFQEHRILVRTVGTEFLDRLLVNHRFAFRLADVSLEPLPHLLGELLISDEAAKVMAS